MTYVLVLLFHSYMYDSATAAPGLFADKAACEAAGEQWKIEAAKRNIYKPNYFCMPR